MKHIVKVGRWQFEAKQFFGRKVEKFGQAFDASLVITITNGTPFVELAINKDEDEFSVQDHRDIRTFLDLLGLGKHKYSRFKNNEKKEVKN